MRAILLALLVLGTFVAIAPTTATAHVGECPWGDWNCWLKCTVHDQTAVLKPDEHACRWVFYPYP